MSKMQDSLKDLAEKTYSSERDVTEEFVTRLLELLGYETGEITREQRLSTPYHKVGTEQRKYIIPDYVITLEGRIAFVIDAKSPNVNVRNRDYVQQIHSYAAHREVQADFFIISNALETIAYRSNVTTFEPIFSLPLNELSERVEELIERLSRDSVLQAVKMQQITERKISHLRGLSPDIIIKERGEGILDTPLLGFRQNKEGKYIQYPERLENALTSPDPIIIFGHGGQGKTILATEIAKRFLEGKFGEAYNNYAPIILNCGDLNEPVDRNRDSYNDPKIDSLVREQARVQRLPGTLFREHRFVFIIDDYQKLNPDYINAMEKTIREIKKEGNLVILFSRLERTDIHPPQNLGYKTMQINTEAIAQETDEFIIGRIPPKHAEGFRQYLRQYDSSVTGYYLTKLFLTMIFPIGKDKSKGVIRYVVDPLIARAISEGKPLTRAQLYEAQTDYIIGCDIERRYGEWGIDQVRVEIVKRKNQLAEKAFQDIFGNNTSNGR